MSALNPPGSATGNPRNKTALSPGKSLMDWVRLCNSGKDMSGTGGALLNVTMDQLALHNKTTDAWLAIRGIVYNVTEYMSFHPGGEAELMRGVGIDATKLFNQVHPWVNYESLLKACVIGRLKSSSTTSLSTWADGIEKPTNDRISNLNSKLSAANISRNPSVSEEPCRIIFKMDWFQQTASLSLIFYFKTNSAVIAPPFQVSVFLNQNKYLMVCIGEEIDLYELEDEVRWPCSVKIHQTVAEIRLMKQLPKLWTYYGKKLESDANIEKFYNMKVVHISDITHDTKLIGLQYEDNVIHHVHAGHHVQFKKIVEGQEVIRSYTPVSFLVSNNNLSCDASLFFVVKEYSTGNLSRLLCSSKMGDIIEVSRPSGSFNCMVLKKRLKVVLLAAGTGLTPMTSLIIWALKSTRLNVTLIYFNKTEDDIIWKDDMNKLIAENTRFHVTHVLSQPSPCWTGEKGIVSQNMVKLFLADPVAESYACICGPNEFNNLCVSFVTECGFTENDYHCFRG